MKLYNITDIANTQLINKEKISDQLHDQVRISSAALGRSINAQAEHWLRVGQLAEHHPQLNYESICALLLQAVSPGETKSLSMPAMIILGAVYAAMLYFTFIFTIRRLHDRNHSGWLSLLLLVPLANIGIALYLLFAPGDAQSNAYGAPRATAGWESVLAWIYIALMALTLIGGIAAGMVAHWTYVLVMLI